MKRYFGTDGVRGVAGKELTAEMACVLGEAAVKLLGPRLVIGRDTRLSGETLESALVAGISSQGGKSLLLGVIPTPAVALLCRQLDADGGIVISASHNPPEYNGIKFFDRHGYKLSAELEGQFEAQLQNLLTASADSPGQSISVSRQFTGQGESSGGDDTRRLSARVNEDLLSQDVRNLEKKQSGQGNGRGGGSDSKSIQRLAVRIIANARERYIKHAISIVTSSGVDLQGLKVALDCGNGAAFATTPAALRKLGAEVVAINADGDGAAINVESGSTNLEPLRRLRCRTGADLGIAHDGDADRAIAIDDTGRTIDGDYIAAICALELKTRGELANNTVVSTVMCNFGFTEAMRRAEITVVQTPVGDANVLAALRRGQHILGGEQSGHMIFLRHNTTGDGLITALMLLLAMRRSGKSLSQLATAAMTKYPQELVNVKVGNKAGLETNKPVARAKEAAQAQLEQDGGGRVLIRASGTEPLVRVMVEAVSAAVAREQAQALATLVAQELA